MDNDSWWPDITTPSVPYYGSPHNKLPTADEAIWRGTLGLSATAAQRRELRNAALDYQDLLDEQRRVLGYDHPDALNAADRIALCHCLTDRYHDALAVAQSTLERRVRLFGGDQPDNLIPAISRARDLHDRRRDKEAWRLIEVTLTGYGSIDTTHPDLSAAIQTQHSTVLKILAAPRLEKAARKKERKARRKANRNAFLSRWSIWHRG